MSRGIHNLRSTAEIRKTALVLACVVCTRLSRRVHGTSCPIPEVDLLSTRASAHGRLDAKRQLALIVLAFHPATAFSPPGWGICFPSRSSSKAGSQPAALGRRNRYDLLMLEPRTGQPVPLIATQACCPAEAEDSASHNAVGCGAASQERAHSRHVGYRSSYHEQKSPPDLSRRMLLTATAASCFALSLPAFAADAGPPLGYLPLLKVDVGRSAFAAVETEFPPAFIALLARFLVNNEQVTRRWWEQKEREAAAFVPMGNPPFTQLAEELRETYVLKTFSTLITSVEVGLEKYEDAAGVPKLVSLLKGRYKSPSQKRRLAQLFSLVSSPTLQPTGTIGALLGEADNARVASVSLIGGSSKDTDSKTSDMFSTADPQVIISPPPGTGGRAAKAKPTMRGTGRWRAAQLVDGGLGYAAGEMPEVSISSEAAAVFERQAIIRATTRDGKVVGLVLEDAGAGYLSGNRSKLVSLDLFIAPPSQNSSGARAARAKLLPEYALVGLEVVDGGSGYNLDEPPSVIVRDRGNTTTVADRKEVVAIAILKAGNPRQLLAPTALQELEGELQNGLSLSWKIRKKTAALPTMLTLPSALVPRRDTSTGTYRLPISIPSGAFGRRAEVPIETRSPLSLSVVSRVFLAGAVCSSTAHTALVPLDVVKTTLQQDAERYASPIDCAKDLVEKDGPGSLFKGAAATIVGYAIAGALSFGLVEVFSRALRDAAGPGISLFFGLPLLTLAAGVATVFVSAALCPFEAVRVQSVKTGQPGLEVLQEILATDGIGGLFRGIQPILLKEVPFVVTKFIVFDTLLDKFLSYAQDADLSSPTAGAGLTALAGALAGLAAVLISQPADSVFTLANDGPGVSLSSAVEEVLQTPALITNGLGPRLLFGVLLVSLQFFLFTLVRSALGVSQDDLTLVWDALAPLLS